MSETLFKAKPILFNTEMVKAILGNGKTVTRRVLKNQDKHAFAYDWNYAPNGEIDDVDLICEHNGKQYALANKPPYRIGDILYVRETWKQATCDPAGGGYALTDKYLYKADYKAETKMLEEDKWHPSIHMPKEAARIFLRVTNIRVERLQDIITDDYRTPLNINKEGLYTPCLNCTHHHGECEDFIADKKCKLVDGYVHLWNSAIKKSNRYIYGWDANPWVFTIEFERIEMTNAK